MLPTPTLKTTYQIDKPMTVTNTFNYIGESKKELPINFMAGAVF